jgi:hypothetical protein
MTALAFPLVRDVSTYFHTTRLKYYTGKEDINRNLALISVASIGLGMIFVLLIHINFLRSVLLIIIMLMGIIALLTAISGLFAVRLGLLEKYVCDVANCAAWIPIRYSAWNCHLSGRVICKKCVREICGSCPVYEKTHCLIESDLTTTEYNQLPCLILSSQREVKIVQSEIKATQSRVRE